jgi:hypothetical protein
VKDEITSVHCPHALYSERLQDHGEGLGSEGRSVVLDSPFAVSVVDLTRWPWPIHFNVCHECIHKGEGFSQWTESSQSWGFGLSRLDSGSDLSDDVATVGAPQINCHDADTTTTVPERQVPLVVTVWVTVLKCKLSPSDQGLCALVTVPTVSSLLLTPYARAHTHAQSG